MANTSQLTLNQRTLTMTKRTSGFKLVGELRGHYQEILDLPVVYRWWFPEDSLVVMYILHNYPNPKGVQRIEDLLPRLKMKEIHGKLYYALYVGQSVDGHHRFSQHSAGNAHTSTLRHTIAALLYSDLVKKEMEAHVDALLNTCFFEWIDFPEDAELVETIEAQCIAVGCYPLNIDANRSIDEKWIEYVMEQRKKI